MGKICLNFIYILLIIAFTSSCATVEKIETKQIPEKHKISKIVQHDKVNLGKKRGLKRKVAIARFTNESKYGHSFFLDNNNDRIGKQAVDILSSKL